MLSFKKQLKVAVNGLELDDCIQSLACHLLAVWP